MNYESDIFLFSSTRASRATLQTILAVSPLARLNTRPHNYGWTDARVIDKTLKNHIARAIRLTVFSVLFTKVLVQGLGLLNGGCHMVKLGLFMDLFFADAFGTEEQAVVASGGGHLQAVDATFEEIIVDLALTQ